MLQKRITTTLRQCNIVLFIAAALILAAQPAMAAFWGEGAPDWSGRAGYTNQTWTFSTEPAWEKHWFTGNVYYEIDPPLAADKDVDNGNLVNNSGVAGAGTTGAGMFNHYYTNTFPAGSWGWVETPMMGNWEGVEGMVGGMGTGYFDFYLPIENVPGTTSVWMQYVSYIPNGQNWNNITTTEFASDKDFANSMNATRTSSESIQIEALNDAGSSGNWWRTTEMWELEDAGDLVFFRVHLDASGTSNMMDSLQVMTSTVPVPGAFSLLGIGLIGLVGAARRNRA